MTWSPVTHLADGACPAPPDDPPSAVSPDTIRRTARHRSGARGRGLFRPGLPGRPGPTRLHRVLAGPAAATVAWVVAVALVAVAVVGTVALQRRAAAAARAWGDARAVWVVRDPRPAGHLLTEADLVLRWHPAGSVPDGAPDAASPPVGRRLAAPVSAGEVVVSARLAGEAAAGPALAAGQVALQLDGALVSRPGGVALAPGTPVVILLAEDPTAVFVAPDGSASAADAGGATAVGSGSADAVTAIVLEDRVTSEGGGAGGMAGPLVAVDRADAARLATAIRQRTVVVGLVSAQPPPRG